MQMTLPWEVADLWSEALDLARKMSGSDAAGGQIKAMSQECLGSWLPMKGI